MMMTKRSARKICNEMVGIRFPGYYLLMDRLSKNAYASLWGKEEKRVEIVLNRQSDVSTAYVARYKIF